MYRGRILVVQTAFVGDVILTTPLLTELVHTLGEVAVDVLVTPAGASVLAGHPAVHKAVIYDKRGNDRGIVPAQRLISTLRQTDYDIAILPHRSLRSAALCYLAGIPRRIGFSTSAATFLLTDIVTYRNDLHEVSRNLALLAPLAGNVPGVVFPSLHPSQADGARVDELLGKKPDVPLVALAPGSVWATKRWPVERYAEVALRAVQRGWRVALIGGPDDRHLGDFIERSCLNGNLVNAIGSLSLLQSAELIRRSSVLVTNDSAPLHMATAMRTPVVAVFGATVPEFGFGPMGEKDSVVQRSGLSCRPCAIHGGNSCPIKTFECMLTISPSEVLGKIDALIVSAKNAV